MATTLIENIGQILHINTQNARVLCKSQMREFPRTEKAWLLVEDDRIADWGQENPPPAEQKVDAGGGLVLPTFVDSHTHLVYAGTREDEFAQRLAGLTYSEIAARGGGILNSARKLRESSFEALYLSAAQRLEELIAMGTGALEIKSGYGLSTDSERKMLQVARQLGKDFPLPIKTSFLGAHALPPEYANRREDYVKLLSEEMLPALVEEGLVDYLDVFCERGYFDLEETLYLVRQASDLGLKSKLHVNQFNSFGAVPALVAEGVLSLDHLEVMEEADCAALAKSQTIGTLLPGCSLFLEIPFAPARKLLDQGAYLALASDFNPGSAPSGNMGLMISLACIKMKMSPEEALAAATLNGAAALELSPEIGSIEKGKRANFILTRPLPSATFLAYNFGHHHLNKIFLNGVEYVANL